jgi:hypothetical protein
VPKYHEIKTNKGPGGNPSCALNLDSRHTWVVISTSWLLQQRGRRPPYPLDKALSRPYSISGGEEKHLCPCREQKSSKEHESQRYVHNWTQCNNTKFWEELIAFITLIRHGPHRKRRLQQFFLATGRSLPSSSLATIGGYTDKPTDTRVQQFFYCCVYSLT